MFVLAWIEIKETAHPLHRRTRSTAMLRYLNRLFSNHQCRHFRSLFQRYGISQSTNRSFTQNAEETKLSSANTRGAAGIVANVRSLSRRGKLAEAMNMLRRMDGIGLKPDGYTYSCFVRGCSVAKSGTIAKEVFLHMKQTGFRPDVFILTKLISVQAKWGSLNDARTVFDEMSVRNRITWNVMISAYVRKGHHEKAAVLFRDMTRSGVQIDQHLLASALKVSAGSGTGSLKLGEQIHGIVLKSGFDPDLVLRTALLVMYATCGSMKDAKRVFDETRGKDVVSWNGMLSGYAGHRFMRDAYSVFDQMPLRNVVSWTILMVGFLRKGYREEGLQLFKQMAEAGVRADHFTFASILGACADLGALPIGRQFHAQVLRSGFEGDLVVSSALVDLYAKCQHMDDAHQIFDNMGEKDVVSWNGLVAGCAKSGNLKKACQIFAEMPVRNVISWTELISGYVDHKQWQEALLLFQKMHLLGPKPDELCYERTLTACSSLAAMGQAKQLHAQLVKCGYDRSLTLGKGLIHIYSRSGSITDALTLFRCLEFRDTASWNAIIIGCAHNGLADKALQVFDRMLLSGFVPDSLTFAAILSACCHAGLVDRFSDYFDSMNKGFDPKYRVKQDTCMVDMLGQLGSPIESHNLIMGTYCESYINAWKAFFLACRARCNVELQRLAAEVLLVLRPESLVSYIVLSKVYACNGMVEEASMIMKLLEDRALQISPASRTASVNHVPDIFWMAIDLFLEEKQRGCVK